MCSSLPLREYLALMHVTKMPKLVDAGVDFMWRVVLDMPSKEGQLITSSHAVVRASQELLIRLYKRQDSDSPVPQQLCEHFVR